MHLEIEIHEFRSTGCIFVPFSQVNFKEVYFVSMVIFISEKLRLTIFPLMYNYCEIAKVID